MTTPRKDYTENFGEFEKFVGMLNGEQLEKLNLGVEFEDNGGVETYHLQAIMDFVSLNPAYHVVTQTDGDGVCCYSNQIRYVNRMKYYLANGSKDDMECCDEETFFRRDEEEEEC